MATHILMVLLLSKATFASTDFCDGYKDGYQEGYCDGQFGCLKPLAPLCPLPNIGESTFKDGYNRGFKAGLKKKSGGL